MDQPAGPAERKRPPTPGSWRPGISGNPKGRPRKGNALTESIQAGVDPDELRDIALQLARNGATESTRIAALNWLRDSGYTRPAERHEVGPPGSTETDEDQRIARLPVDRLRRYLELEQEQDALLDDGDQPQLLESSGPQPAAEDADRE